MTIALVSNSVSFDKLLLQTNKLNLATLTAAVACALQQTRNLAQKIKSDTVLQVPASLGKSTLLWFALPGRLNLSTLKRLLLTPNAKCCSASFPLPALSMLSQLGGQVCPIFCRFLIKTKCEQH